MYVTFYTVAPKEWFSVTWQGRPIATEKLSGLTIEQINGPDVTITDDTSPDLLSAGPQGDCLPISERELNGIKDGTPVSELIASGIPVVRGNIIPDFFGIETFSHDGLRFSMLNDTVVEVFSTDPKWVTPSGLRVGLHRAEVIDVLGWVPQRYGEGSQQYEFRICDDGADLNTEFIIFVIAFGSDQKVREIKIEREWP